MFGSLKKTSAGSNLYGNDNKKKLENIKPASLRPSAPALNGTAASGPAKGGDIAVSDKSIFGQKLATLKKRKEFTTSGTQTEEEITNFAAEFLKKPEEQRQMISVLSNKPVDTYADKVKELVTLEKKVIRMETTKKLNKEMADDLDELDEIMKLLRNSKTISMAKDIFDD